MNTKKGNIILPLVLLVAAIVVLVFIFTRGGGVEFSKESDWVKFVDTTLGVSFEYPEKYGPPQVNYACDEAGVIVGSHVCGQLGEGKLLFVSLSNDYEHEGRDVNWFDVVEDPGRQPSGAERRFVTESGAVGIRNPVQYEPIPETNTVIVHLPLNGDVYQSVAFKVEDKENLPEFEEILKSITPLSR